MILTTSELTLLHTNEHNIKVNTDIHWSASGSDLLIKLTWRCISHWKEACISQAQRESVLLKAVPVRALGWHFLQTFSTNVPFCSSLSVQMTAEEEIQLLRSQLREREEQVHQAARAGLDLLNQQMELQNRLDEQRVEMTNALEVWGQFFLRSSHLKSVNPLFFSWFLVVYVVTVCVCVSLP